MDPESLVESVMIPVTHTGRYRAPGNIFCYEHSRQKVPNPWYDPALLNRTGTIVISLSATTAFDKHSLFSKSKGSTLPEVSAEFARPGNVLTNAVPLGTQLVSFLCYTHLTHRMPERRTGLDRTLRAVDRISLCGYGCDVLPVMSHSWKARSEPRITEITCSRYHIAHASPWLFGAAGSRGGPLGG